MQYPISFASEFTEEEKAKFPYSPNWETECPPIYVNKYGERVDRSSSMKYWFDKEDAIGFTEYKGKRLTMDIEFSD